MRTLAVLLSLLALAGCAGVARDHAALSPCEQYGEASYACQVQRYHDVNAD